MRSMFDLIILSHDQLFFLLVCNGGGNECNMFPLVNVSNASRLVCKSFPFLHIKIPYICIYIYKQDQCLTYYCYWVINCSIFNL